VIPLTMCSGGCGQAMVVRTSTVGSLAVCPVCDGDAADVKKIHPRPMKENGS
jgi:hypothetical protein